MDNLQQLKDLVKSEEWRAFQKLMKVHQQYLNDQALRSLDQGKSDKALEFRLRYKECSSILNLIDEPLSQIKGDEEDGR